VNRLPKAENLVYLAGQKFGTSENKSLTWVSNTLIPANVTGHFKDSRIVALSTGCVYPLACSQGKGSNEQDSPEPVGEYAQSCLGRERIFEYFSKRNHTSVCLVRLNYATDLRYGVLVDIAGKVKKSIPVDLSMGYFNAIWQGDAIRMILKCTSLCSTPPTILNVTGPEKISVRWLAEHFGSRFNTPPVFIGNEMGNALLSDATIASSYFNEPEVSLERMIRWTADWIDSDGRILDIPTHFEVRNGEF
jgi:nucleoside-diphosphate-sugar epimerase